jgi:hypothetical protein
MSTPLIFAMGDAFKVEKEPEHDPEGRAHSGSAASRQGAPPFLERNGILWNSRSSLAKARAAMSPRMTRTVTSLLLLAAVPALAAPGGSIGTMQRGHYVCELPGDATGPAGQRMPDSDFTITNASSYQSAGLAGTYLLTDNILIMTSGPMQGQRYRKKSGNFLRLIAPDGSDSALRCVRQVSNNS